MSAGAPAVALLPFGRARLDGHGGQLRALTRRRRRAHRRRQGVLVFPSPPNAYSLLVPVLCASLLHLPCNVCVCGLLRARPLLLPRPALTSACPRRVLIVVPCPRMLCPAAVSLVLASCPFPLLSTKPTQSNPNTRQWITTLETCNCNCLQFDCSPSAACLNRYTCFLPFL